MRDFRRFDWLNLLFWGSIIWFAVGVFMHFKQPGFSVTQAHHGMWASEAIKRIFALFTDPDNVRFSRWDGFHDTFFVVRVVPWSIVRLPIISVYYTGVAVVYFMVPFVLLFGHSVFGAKIGFILGGFASIFMFRYCMQRWFGRVAGLLAAIFLAVDPVFIRCLRLGAEKEENFFVLLLWSGIFLLQLGLDRRKWFFCYMAAFIWGVGLWSKFTCWGYMGGAVVGLAFTGRYFGGFLASVGWKKRQYITFLLFLIIGLLPFIIYNLLSDFESIRNTQKVLTQPMNTFGYVVDNRDMLGNFITRAGQLWSMMCGDLLRESVIGVRFRLLGCFAAISFAGCFFLMLKSKLNASRKCLIIEFYCVYIVLFFLSIFTPSEHEPAHLVSLVPFWQIVSGVFCAYCLRYLRGVLKACIIAAIVVSIGMQMFSVTVYLNRVGQAGSSYGHFGKIFECRDFLRENKIEPLVYLSSNCLWSNIDYGLYYENKNFEAKRLWPEKFYFICEGGNIKDHVKGREFLKMLRKDTSLKCSLIREFYDNDRKYWWEVWCIDVVGKVNESALWFSLIAQEPELHVLFFTASEKSDARSFFSGVAYHYPRNRLQDILRGKTA